MERAASIRQQLIKAINELPADALPELADFIEYLRVKMNPSKSPPEAEIQPDSGSAFLLSIAELGAADEVDPVHGWGFSQDKPQ